MKYLIALTLLINTTAYAGEIMQININGKDYVAQMDDNATAADIMAMLPATVDMTKFAGHEYYGTLPRAVRTDAPHTSKLQAGHLYYWDGGDTFVINYADYDISPYSSIHIGEITEPAAMEFLRGAGNKITITLKK